MDHGHSSEPSFHHDAHRIAAEEHTDRSRIGKFFHDFDGPRSAYHFLWAWAGAHLHGNPSRNTFVIGVTGTKGKTTTLEVINAVLERAGKKTALISSLRMKIGDESAKNKTGNSMPGHAYIQKFLRKAAREHCTYVLIEVTSQAVVQHRHRFVHWNMGVITNLAPEHIESHGSFENYREAKLDFLKYVVNGGGKVFLNRDDKHFDFFMEALDGVGPFTYSKDDEFLRTALPDIRAAKLRQGDPAHFLMSPFNEQNIAVAAAIAKEIGFQNKVIEDAIADFEGVAGRMEYIHQGNYTAIVDYAHTPDSLEVAYAAAKPKPSREFPHPRLICVLGAAGGGRDTWKRPAMGGIAADLCDDIVITNEDPYDEDPEDIMNEIASGIPQPLREGQNIYKIVDRAAAIKKAVLLANEGDVIIGTGKGSEDWIHIADDEKVSWNERAAFEAALAKRAARPQESASRRI